MEIVPFELRKSLSRFSMRPIRAMYGSSAEFPTRPAAGTLKGWDIGPRLGSLRMPTLVLAGEFDGDGPSSSPAIHREIRGARLVLLPDTGHTGFYQRRELFVRSLRDFLESTRRVGRRRR